MGTMSIWHWLILLAVVLIFFGGSGKISAIMGDVAKGIKSFKKGMQDDEARPADPASQPPANNQISAAPAPAQAQPGQVQPGAAQSSVAQPSVAQPSAAQAPAAQPQQRS